MRFEQRDELTLGHLSFGARCVVIDEDACRGLGRDSGCCGIGLLFGAVAGTTVGRLTLDAQAAARLGLGQRPLAWHLSLMDQWSSVHPRIGTAVLLVP
ncbi:MAG: hypothetical protein E6J90_02780 [Deltaproteobacteria bacterium]|nr:MAG: hypothetical protein E6J91_42915 [Deltaproteobacteria bacterium]TMQ27315.1 MAG: hypothetical protein E6J90_02780 [Deltaproteobacteria bacterium]